MGVEDGSALGSPRMAGALHQRTDHASGRGWGVTGHDRDGNPRGVAEDGLTRDPFLYHLEMMLRDGRWDEGAWRPSRKGTAATMLVRWAYMGWGSEELALSLLHPRRAKTMQDDPIVVWETDALEALLERTIRQLWHDCQREPVRYAICRTCRRRDCICGQRSEAQVNAEDAA